jgi:hypothetical protein
MVVCNFCISIVKDKKWLLVLKIVPEGVSWPTGSPEKLFLAQAKKKFGPPYINPRSFSSTLFTVNNLQSKLILRKMSSSMV